MIQGKPGLLRLGRNTSSPDQRERNLVPEGVLPLVGNRRSLRGNENIRGSACSCAYVVASTDVAIKELSGRGEKRIGHDGKDAFREAHAPPGTQVKWLPRGKPVILKRPAHSSPILFEGNQAGVVGFRTTEIEFQQAIPLGVLDRSPEEKRISGEVVEPRIGSSIFVNEGVFVLYGDNAGDGLVVL